MSIEAIISIVTSVVGLIGGGIGILFWRENKRLKQEEANQSNVETQSKEIDLGKKYIEESVNVVKNIKSLLETNNADTAAIASKMSGVESRLLGMEGRMVEMEKKMATNNRTMVSYNKRLGTMERFLNGNLKDFAAKEEQAKKKAKEVKGESEK